MRRGRQPETKKPRRYRGFEEREKGFEPSTLALARRCSTTELFPLKDGGERGRILLMSLRAVKQRRARDESVNTLHIERRATKW